jgi:hypothetical protein
MNVCMHAQVMHFHSRISNRVHMNMNECMYACTSDAFPLSHLKPRAYEFVYMLKYAYMHTHIYSMHIYMQTYLPLVRCTPLNVVHIHVYIYIYTHTCIFILTYSIHTYIHTDIFNSGSMHVLNCCEYTRTNTHIFIIT